MNFNSFSTDIIFLTLFSSCVKFLNSHYCNLVTIRFDVHYTTANNFLWTFSLSNSILSLSRKSSFIILYILHLYLISVACSLISISILLFVLLHRSIRLYGFLCTCTLPVVCSFIIT